MEDLTEYPFQLMHIVNKINKWLCFCGTNLSWINKLVNPSITVSFRLRILDVRVKKTQNGTPI